MMLTKSFKRESDREKREKIKLYLMIFDLTQKAIIHLKYGDIIGGHEAADEALELGVKID